MFGIYSHFGLWCNYLCNKNLTISCFTILTWNRANFNVRGPSSLHHGNRFTKIRAAFKIVAAKLAARGAFKIVAASIEAKS